MDYLFAYIMFKLISPVIVVVALAMGGLIKATWGVPVGALVAAIAGELDLVAAPLPSLWFPLSVVFGAASGLVWASVGRMVGERVRSGR